MSVLRQQAAALPDHRLWVTHATTFFLILYNYQKKKKKKKEIAKVTLLPSFS